MYQNVYDSLRPHFLMSKVLGYALFSFNESFELVVRKSDAVFGGLNILLTFLLNFVYWNSFFEIEFERFEIVKCFFPTVTYINFIIFTSAKVWIFYQRKNFGKLHKILYFVDKELLTFGFKFDYNQHGKIVLTHMGCINLVHLIFCFFFRPKVVCCTGMCSRRLPLCVCVCGHMCFSSCSASCRDGRLHFTNIQK